MKIKKISVLILCFLCVGCNNSTASIYRVISSKDVYEVKNDIDVVIIDVRTLAEYSSGHIDNAMNIPVDKISNIAEIVENKDKKIIVYCASGNRSKEAAEKLISMGYTNVYDMKGLNSWEYELEK